MREEYETFERYLTPSLHELSLKSSEIASKLTTKKGSKGMKKNTENTAHGLQTQIQICKYKQNAKR